MATRRYGISRGQHQSDITEAAGAAVSSDDIELTFDLTKSLTKEDIKLALDAFWAYIDKDTYPPA